MAQISFFQPNLVIDPRQGKLWDIELRLGNVSKLINSGRLVTLHHGDPIETGNTASVLELLKY